MLAVLYDIHANLPALEAVVADAEAAGADRWVLGGDYAGLGAWPVETLERLHALPGAQWVRGNWERWQASPGDAPDVPFIQNAIRWVREALGEEPVAELARLSQMISYDGTLFCHASPVSDMRSFMPRPHDEDEELLAGVGERRLMFGHTHLQFRRESANGIELVNPGSVGLPFDGDQRSAYALVSDDGELELRRVDYDYERSAAAIRERMQGFGEELAERVDTATPPPP
jgi:predicted phosphodiesterase